MNRYRRILFVGILPLISSNTAQKAATGMFFGTCSTVFYRELEPFRKRSSNFLVYIAQYVITFTFAGALVLSTGKQISHKQKMTLVALQTSASH